MLVEHTLFGTVDKVKTAIERLQMFEPPEGYHLAYSGGKDSDTILALSKMAGVKFEAVYNLTTVDPPELVRHVKTHTEVIISRPPKTMWQLIQENGMPPLRQMRYCCRILKERGGKGRLVLTGVRAEESPRRAKRQMSEACYNDNRKRFLHVIIDWTKDDVWEFLKTYNVPYCKLYDEGLERIGCVCCPNANQLKQAQRWPKIAEAYKRACVKAYKLRVEKGLKTSWKSGEEMFYQWISGQGSLKDDADNPQERFFFE